MGSDIHYKVLPQNILQIDKDLCMLDVEVAYGNLPVCICVWWPGLEVWGQHGKASLPTWPMKNACLPCILHGC